ncbi:MAG: PASTA domain-containing protein [Candidatus Schekmanbacteria bacterium]|nr:PASTA domain-containing protein [Candidatus Schekmanbacteria bacterium]
MVPNYVKIVGKYGLLFFIFIAIGAITGVMVMNFITKPEEITVPDIKGKSIDNALAECGEAGINIRIAGKAFDTKIPLYHVISQSPEPGKKVKKGREIDIIISKGTIKAYVPDVIGKNLQDAEMLISEARLNLGRVLKVHSETYPDNVAIATYPAPGRDAPRGVKISLLISAGQFEKTYIMPNLSGLTENQAYNLLDEMGVKLGELRREYDSGKPAGTIVSQQPPYGYNIRSGEEVSLAISTGGKGTSVGKAVSGAKNVTKTAVKTYRSYTFTVPDAPKNRNVRVILISGNTTREIYNKVTPPGKLINLFFEVSGKTIMKVFVDGEVIAENNY